MKKTKYILFFIIVLLFFYGAFAIVAASFNPFNWDEITRIHYILYGFVANGVFTVFYFINDHFKLK